MSESLLKLDTFKYNIINAMSSETNQYSNKFLFQHALITFKFKLIFTNSH